MLEICCGSYEDGIIAYKCGIKRIELTSATFLGGLTPSIASVQLLKENTDLQIISMVRSRGAGFNYSDLEFEQMKREAELLLKAGSKGLAFGAIDNSKKLDFYKVNKIYELCDKYDATFVLHRAYDCIENYEETLKILSTYNNVRILTSGRCSNAFDGIEHIKYLQKNYGDKIEILAGCGINSNNVYEIIKNTNVKQIHATCKTFKYDISTSNGYVSYSYRGDDSFECASEEEIKKMKNIIDINI